MDINTMKTTFGKISVGSKFIQIKLKRPMTKIVDTSKQRQDFYGNWNTIVCQARSDDGRLWPVFDDEPVELIEGSIDVTIPKEVRKIMKDEEEEIFKEVIKGIKIKFIEI